MLGLKWLLIVPLVSLSCIDTADILVVSTFPGKSHGILGDGIVRLLLAAGHQVTYITSFPTRKSYPNLTEVDVSHNMELSPINTIKINSILDKEVDPRDVTRHVHVMLNLSNSTYTSENVQKIIMDPLQKFDAVIGEWLFSEMSSGFAALFDCPLIWFSTMEPHWMVTKLIDERLHPAYNPDWTTKHLPPFTFKQRVQELWNQIFMSTFMEYFFVPKEEKIYQAVFGPAMALRGKSLPSYYDMRFNGSLMLGNSHVSLGQATRLPQNYKPIGGCHIDFNFKPLPEDLKKIFDNAEHGVVYFSMGSNLKSKDIPEKLKKDLLEMFGTLKYAVLWKFEEVLSDLPRNVHIVKWAPQLSVLAHPKTIVFITHGGLLSTIETVHFGVPIIGIPVFADQFNNVDRTVKKGFAKRVDLSYTMAHDLKAAIEEIVNNPRYAAKVKELSLIYHDRPVSPGKELVHWVEHVIKTKGAPHLRSPALHVPWYQKMYFDLAALMMAGLLAIKIVLKRLFYSKKRITSLKKNN
ncbi:UDP-glucuronosyltransferase 2B15-like [Hyposmocoma kahamanoa]|uniref:UDP-glucuronosyltransferase 2B15-like n=1 Tax=Hyposmocoma kahamanoa TaxID=1477025 RepID=UPI000E6D7414|nr:UDP-glucuronosyltransferase 2B15-like [Hyposmocoma kahamanoa]